MTDPAAYHTITPIIFHYLDMLADRTVSLEQRIELDEIRKLRTENQKLREELIQNNILEMEQLLSFLPVIYKDFWSSVSPSELALLGGTLNIKDIADMTIYSEPSHEVIMHMKKKLQGMPKSKQEEIIQFCRGLPFKVTVRPEMKEFLNPFK
jgi:hypothetical protein